MYSITDCNMKLEELLLIKEVLDTEMVSNLVDLYKFKKAYSILIKRIDTLERHKSITNYISYCKICKKPVNSNQLFAKDGVYHLNCRTPQY